MTNIIFLLRRWATELKHQTYALYLAYKDPRSPWYAKVFGALVVAYAFSPIDLIPDFIPIIGYLDDLILLPLGIALAVRMIPKEVMQECLVQARADLSNRKHTNWIVGTLIISVWVAVSALLVVAILRKVA